MAEVVRIIVERIDFQPLPLSQEWGQVAVEGTQGEEVLLIVDVDQLRDLNAQIARSLSGQPHPNSER